MSWRLTIAAAAFVLAGCTSALTVAPESDFTLRVNETATLSGTTISVRVDSVVGDSRCPINAVCVWAGNAAVWLRLMADAEPGTNAAVNTMVDPRSTSFEGKTITLVGLDPQPTQGKPISQSDYRVRLRFSQ